MTELLCKMEVAALPFKEKEESKNERNKEWNGIMKLMEEKENTNKQQMK